MEIEAELTLRKENLAYVAELRAKQGEDSELRFGPFFVVIDAEELANLEPEPERYGQAISDALFQENGLVWALGEIYGIAQGSESNLRLRLFIDRSAPELDALRWELLRIPGTTECLSTCDDIFFSRYTLVRREAPPPKPLANWSVLAAVSSPSDTQPDNPIPLLGETFSKAFFEEALADLPVDFLPEEDEHCTLELLARSTVGHDVLLLAANSKQTSKGMTLLLQDSNGKTRGVLIEKLGARLQKLRALPRLVLLLGDHSPAVAAGLMADLGVPAVIAMHGPVDLETWHDFLQALFAALRENGAIDRAVTVARREIGEQCDEYAPVLYMSLPSGALWRDPSARPAAGRSQAEKAAPQPAAKEQPAAEKPAVEKQPAAEAAPEIPDRVAIYAKLGSPAFSMEDLEVLCFLLGVDWDSLRGETHSIKAISLIRHLEANMRLADLVKEIRRLRPELKL